MGSISRRLVLAGAGGLLAAPTIVRAQGTNGVALVIGNSKYQWEASLPNVKRDATDVAKRFQALGLKTEFLENLDRNAMKAAVANFFAASRGARLSAFYFAGHGVFWEANSYVVPVDVSLDDPAVAKTLPEVTTIFSALNEAAYRLAVYDSCRNSPAEGWRQRQARKAAAQNASAFAAAPWNSGNTLMFMSTANGGIALDGPAGQNSPFAAAFLRQLASPSVDLQSLPTKIRRDLLLATEGRQLMHSRGGYRDSFVLNALGQPAASSAAGYDPSRIVELNSTYAYAAKYNLFLPSGLVAYRPTGPHAHKVGAFAAEYPTRTPNMFIVLSAPDGNSAEVIWTTIFKDIGSFWRYETAPMTDNTLEWSNQTETFKIEVKWHDKDSGTLQYSSLKPFGTFPPPARFTRLDG